MGQDPILWDKIKALEPNLIGDLLAGVFAPLAFLRLFVATMVQSQQLAEQRHELALTRLEYVETRDVIKAQAAEAKRQAEAAVEQTRLLRQQQAWLQSAEAEKEFDARLQLFQDWFRANGAVEVNVLVVASGRTPFAVIAGNTPEITLQRVCRWLDDLAIFVGARSMGHAMHVEGQLGSLDAVHSHILPMLANMEVLPPRRRVWLQQIGADQALHHFQQVGKWIDS